MAADEIPRIEASESWYPTPPDRFVAKISLVSQIGAFYFVLTPLISFVIMFTELVKEKEQKLRQGLVVVGLSHGSYWLHWIITGAILSFITTLSLVIAGLSCQFEQLLNTNFIINFMLFYFLSFSMVIFAFFLSTLVQSTRIAYTISYAFVLLGVLLEIVLSNALLLYFIFFNEVGGTGQYIIRLMFYFYPPFTFSILYGIISRASSTHFDDSQQAFVEGSYFGWSDLANPEIGYFSQGDNYASPSPWECFGIMVLISLIYSILIWYFDHVISANRGTNESFYFFLEGKYWNTCRSKSKQQIIRKRRRKHTNLEDIKIKMEEINNLEVKDSIYEERMKVLQLEQEQTTSDGLRIVGL